MTNYFIYLSESQQNYITLMFYSEVLTIPEIRLFSKYKLYEKFCKEVSNYLYPTDIGNEFTVIISAKEFINIIGDLLVSIPYTQQTKQNLTYDIIMILEKDCVVDFGNDGNVTIDTSILFTLSDKQDIETIQYKYSKYCKGMDI